MRIIKFRAWDIESPAMVEWSEIQATWESEGYSSSIFDNDHYHCMQYTGLKDKNGVEIYEGDYLTGGVGGDVKPVLIEWKEIESWSGMADGYRINRIGFAFDQYYFILDECEVIGNIHQHPELIKGE